VASTARATWVRHACLLAAVAVSVAGCVGMAQTGPVGTFGNKQADAAQNQGSDVGLFPSGPVPGSSPWDIVQQFLAASASYPADVPIIQEYLAGSAKDWNPGSSVTVLNTNYAVDYLGMQRAGRSGSERALVEVSGPVQAASNSSGQYVSPSAQGGKTVQYQFNLVKVDNQWRISNPPPTYRLITAADFPQYYQAQDLYFFPASGSQSQDQGQSQMLVPDSVFVPKGTPLMLLFRNLVSALAQGPGTTWLQGAAVSAFPPGTKILDVVPYGATVTVNLGGTAVSAKPSTLENVSAQLLWTLAGPSASVPAVQSVELELDGRPWSPPNPPCPNGQAPTAYQGLASYECYDPYPSAPASFSYVGAGQPWSRCGSESVAQDGDIGSIVSVFGRTGSASSRECGGYVDPESPVPFPSAVPTAALSMVAVSPGGDYVAGVSPSPGRDTLYVGSASGTATSFSASERLKDEPDITAISWDRDGDLWAAQGDIIWVVPGSGTTGYKASNSFDGQVVTSLAVAPDSVRIAAIVQDGAGSELELASIYRGEGGGEGVQRGSFVPQFTVGPGIQLGPNLTDPISLTWYNADTLIVLDAESTGNTLWSVPVDGGQASQLPVTPSGAISITADSAANILIAGLTNDRLEFAYSTAGPWEDVRSAGSSPAYP
jgi:Lipoprotein LpqB beta-propeller domain/Sporulation and spore germination